MSYPIILCEDQIIQLNQLERIIDNFILFHDKVFKIVLKTQSPLEVKKYLKQFRPKQGIYFLDIDLNHEVNGIELAEVIRKYDVQAKIIFTTTHDEMLPVTIKRRVETLGFVTKDQTLDEYRNEIVELLLLVQERIDATKQVTNQAFVFSIGSQTFTFDINDIYFVEASKLPHRLSLCTKDGQYEFYGRISELEKKYPMLTRISRACLVNIFNVKEIDFKKRSLYFDSELARNFTLGKAQKIKEKLKESTV